MLKIFPTHPERRPNGRDDHEESFVSRYRQLLRAARRLTEGDAEAADDLLHDAFVQFVRARPELSGIEHLEGDLTTLLRNLHVSGLRRRANQAQAHVAVGGGEESEGEHEGREWTDVA
jgi:DNA-directed RNA polymerase specialized sigma24 family protein